MQRNALAVENRLESVLKTAFGLTDVTPSQWSVRAIVVVEGFGGAASLDERVPLMPEWVLKAGTEANSTLIQLLDWVRSLTWLPQQDRDFDIIESEHLLKDVRVKYPGLVPKRTGRDYLEDAIIGLTATRRLATEELISPP